MASRMELEDLAAKAPDIIDRMRKFIKDGRIGFTNGTYSQLPLRGWRPGCIGKTP